MRRIRYQVACSLDGYIAGPNGETDWIVNEPGIDFGALFAQFDTLLMGRLTYEDALKRGGADWGKKLVVVSSTLRAADHAGVQIISGDIKRQVDALRAQPGKDIWLFGGGRLLASLLDLGCVDTIEPAIVPVLLGSGRPMVAALATHARLELTAHRVYPSGITWLEYAVRAG